MSSRIKMRISLVAGLVAAGGLLVGCDEADSGTKESPGQPTHTSEASEGALFRGVLGGGIDCLWIEEFDTGDQLSMVVPSWMSPVQGNNGVEVVDARSGDVLASVGDPVAITGGFDRNEPGCSDVGHAGSVVVGGLRVCDDPKCEDE